MPDPRASTNRPRTRQNTLAGVDPQRLNPENTAQSFFYWTDLLAILLRSTFFRNLVHREGVQDFGFKILGFWYTEAMHGYVTNIEQATVENTDYRRVLYTAKHSQLVLMCLMPGEEIGEEVHHLDQFIRFEAGAGKIVLGGVVQNVSADMAVVIPEGTRHNVINTGTVPLKLYSIYAPPEHKDGTVHKTKADEKGRTF